MDTPTLAKRSARTAAWSLLMGLVAARFINEVAPVAVQAVVGVGAAVGTDYLLRWREARREARIARLASRGDLERDERLEREQ
jgi:hypothetical protein